MTIRVHPVGTVMRCPIHGTDITIDDGTAVVAGDTIHCTQRTADALARRCAPAPPPGVSRLQERGTS